MRRVTPLAILALVVLGFGTNPATAQTASPAACQGRTIPLATDANGNPIEQLVEHQLYFHGQNPSGNVDSGQDFVDGILGGPDHRLSMNSTAPTGSQSKIFIHNVGDGARWNLNYAMNPALANWRYNLSGDARVVCAEATAYAQTTGGALNVQLWADKALAETDPVVTKPATGGTANQLSKYTANFGDLDFVASLNLIVQLAGPASTGNAPVHYDSTASPGGLTYVTVEPI